MSNRRPTLRRPALALVIALAAAPMLACGSDGRPTISLRSTATPATTLTSPAMSVPADDPVMSAAAFVSVAPPGHPLPSFWAGGPAMREAATTAPANAALAALVMDEASGLVLYEKDAHRQLSPASLTKIATAILAAEHGDLDRTITVDVDSRTMRGSTVMGLIPGDRFTMRDLLHGLMMPSGNDAALAIGRAVSGSDEAFVREMNQLSRRLGLTDTNWANPHGLNGTDHRTSAYDLAILSRYYMSFPDLRDVVAKGAYSARGDRAVPMGTLNPLFGYPGVDGLKTGYTRLAGNTIVTSRVKDGHRIFVVILNDSARSSDAWALSQWAFTSFRWPDVAAAER